MFGIDLGINCASITCISSDNVVIDYQIILGDKKDKDTWSRINHMADATVDEIMTILKSNPKIRIQALATIEEPIYSTFNRNVRGLGILYMLYALTRYKLEKRDFTIYTVNPVTVKAVAKKMAFKGMRLKNEFAKRGRLTKKGMIRAYNKVVGSDPNASTILGRETLADSFFIAKAGIIHRRMELKNDTSR